MKPSATDRIWNAAMRAWESLLVIYLFSVCVRLGCLLMSPPLSLPVDFDAVDYDLLAQNVAVGNGFGYGPGILSSLRPPLHPLLLGVVYYAFGHHHFIAKIVQCFIGAFLPVLVYGITKRTYDVRHAKLAAFVAAIYPPFLFYAGELMTENLFTVLVAASALTILVLREKPRHVAWWILAGVVAGLAVLARSNIAPFIAFSLAWLVLAASAETRIALFKNAMVFCVCAGATVLPWTARNYKVHSALVPISTNSGHIFWLSFNPLTGEEFLSQETKDYLDTLQPRGQSGEEVFRKLASMIKFGLEFERDVIAKRYPGERLPESEVEADRFFRGKTNEFVAAHPGAFIKKMIKDSMRFWHVLDNWGQYMYSYAVIVPFSIAGMILGLRIWRRTLPLYFLLSALFITEVIFHATARFRVPFEPYFIVFAVAGFIAARQKRGLWTVSAAGVMSLAVNTILYFNAETLRGFLKSFF